MKLKSFDHIVLCIRDIDATVAFYRDILGMDPREGKPGKWDLHFGDGKISLQTPETIPDMAKGTLPGTGNFLPGNRDACRECRCNPEGTWRQNSHRPRQTIRRGWRHHVRLFQ